MKNSVMQDRESLIVTQETIGENLVSNLKFLRVSPAEIGSYFCTAVYIKPGYIEISTEAQAKALVVFGKWILFKGINHFIRSGNLDS